MPQLLQNIDAVDCYVCTNGVKLVDFSVGLKFTRRPIFTKSSTDFPSTSYETSPRKITGDAESDTDKSTDECGSDISDNSQESLPHLPTVT